MQLYSSDSFWGDILPRYSFLEPLVTGKRVMEIDCGDGSGVMFLHQYGAVEVIGVEREGHLLQKALERPEVEGVLFRSYDGVRIEAPTGAFDVVVGANLGVDADLDLITEIQRVLHPAGYLVVALWNPKSVSWARQKAGIDPDFLRFNLEERLSGLQRFFPRLTIMGQKPFMGYAIGRMGASPDDVSFEMDNGLVGDQEEPPAFYLIACGRKPLRMDRHSLVQLPTSEVIDRAIGPHSNDIGPECLQPGQPQDQRTQPGELEQENNRLKAENGQLLDQLTKRDEQIAALQAQREENLVAIRAMEEDLKAYTGRSADSERQAEQDRRAVEEIRMNNLNLEKKIAEMAETAASMESTISQADRERLELASVRQELEEMKVRLSDAHAELERMRSEEDERQAIQVSLEHQLEDVREEKDKLAGALQSVQAEAEQARDQLARYENQTVFWERLKEEYEAKLRENENETAVMREKMSQQSDTIAELQHTLSEQNQRYQRLESDLLEMESRLNDAKENEEGLHADLSSIQSVLNERNRELESSLVQIDTLSRESIGFKETIQQLHGTVDSLRADKQQWQAKESELQANLVKIEHERNLQSEQLAQSMQRSQEQDATNRDALEKAHSEMRTLQKRLDELGEQKAGLEETLQQIREELESAQTRRNDEIQSAHIELDKQKEELKKQQHHFQELERELSQTQSALEEEKKQSRFAKEEIDNLRQEHTGWQESAQREREQADRNEQELQERISRLTEQLDAVNKENEHSHLQIDKLKQQLKEFESEAATAAYRYQQLEEVEKHSHRQQETISDLESQLADCTDQVQALKKKLDPVNDQIHSDDSE